MQGVGRPLTADASGGVGFDRDTKLGEESFSDCSLRQVHGVRGRVCGQGRAGGAKASGSQVGWGAGGRCGERCVENRIELGEQQSWEVEGRAVGGGVSLITNFLGYISSA